MHPQLHAALVEAHMRDLRGKAGTRRWHRWPPRGGPPLAEVCIRWAFADDSAALARLAADSGERPPRAPVLLAEVDGRVGAALSLCDGRAIAASAGPDAEALDLLALRAAQLGPASRAAAPHWRVPA